MREFSKEEVKKRQKLIRLIYLFNQKKKLLGEDWTALFERSGADSDRVRILFDQTKSIIEKQYESVADVILELEIELRSFEATRSKFYKNAFYHEILLSHIKKESSGQDSQSMQDQDTQKLAEREQLDLSTLIKLFREIMADIDEQKKIMAGFSGQATGLKAKSREPIMGLIKRESLLLGNIEPFWHDWEDIACKLDHHVKDIQNISALDWKEVQQEIQQFLAEKHGLFSDNGMAPQMGTEFALNLYLNETDQIKKLRGAIPITIVNIDVTHFNNLDTSQRLGDALIRLGREALKSLLEKRFQKSDRTGDIPATGLVTVMGRTRYKIVGIPRNEVESALRRVPPIILPKLKKIAEEVFDENNRFKKERLTTQMYGGCSEIRIDPEKVLNFKELIKMSAELRRTNSCSSRTTILKVFQPDTKSKAVHSQLRACEKSIFLQIETAIKEAAAKAEYFEKEEVKPVELALEQELINVLESEGLPALPTKDTIERYAAFQERVRSRAIEKWRQRQTFWRQLKLPPVLYPEELEEQYKKFYGLNFVPENEFQGRAVERITHQLGLDQLLFANLTEKINQFFKSGANPQEIEELKEIIIHNVLQKRSLSVAYDIRFKRALRPDVYDEIIPKAMLLEGAQVWTFIEIDGFRAFNTRYPPDVEDTYYHFILQEIFNIFDVVFNNGKTEDEKIKPRMTKKGDEIWLSYPLNSGAKRALRKKHEQFLQKLRQRFVLRNDALDVPNTGSADWIPHLIQNLDETNKHVKNALQNKKQLYYVDNTKYLKNFREKIQSGNKAPDEIFSPDWLFEKMQLLKGAIKANKNQWFFDDWKIIDNARQINGEGEYNLQRLNYPLMLFNEYVKGETPGSGRFPTGRIIRLGITSCFTGFEPPYIVLKDQRQTEHLRGILDQEIEKIRRSKGKGTITEIQIDPKRIL